MTHLTESESKELLRLCEAADKEESIYGCVLHGTLRPFVDAARIAIPRLLKQRAAAEAAQASTARRVAEGIAREAKLRGALIETRRIVSACANEGFNYEKAPLDELFRNNGTISAALKEGQDQ
jgi:hypothetical protein